MSYTGTRIVGKVSNDVTPIEPYTHGVSVSFNREQAITARNIDKYDGIRPTQKAIQKAIQNRSNEVISVNSRPPMIAHPHGIPYSHKRPPSP